MKTYDIVSVCNALVDILIRVEESDIKGLNLQKGVMHLVDSARQKSVLQQFHTHAKTIELGGSAMNALRTMAAMGSKAAFVGMVGRDEFGEQIKFRLAELGITAKLSEHGEATGSCIILVTPDGERTMNTNLGASRLYTPEHIPYD